MTTTKTKTCVISMTLTNATVKKAVKSFTMSKRYINTMLRTTVINILYHRLNIDDKEFVRKIFNDVPFITFKSRSKNLLIREFHAYMIACKDAIEKNFLREFFLYLINVNTNEIIEYYKFSFKYDTHQERNRNENEDNLIESTCDLLKNLQHLGSQQKLSEEVQVKVEFTYFDDTPENYEPPGFRAVDESEALIRKLNRNGEVVTIGSLFTGFHELKCRGKGGIFNITGSAPSIYASGTDEIDIEYNPILTEEQKEEVETNSVQFVKEQFTEDLSEPYQRSKVRPNMNDTYLSSQDLDTISVNSTDENRMECPCKLEERCDWWSPDILTCLVCNGKSHTACQGYLDNSFLGRDQVFRCNKCTGEKGVSLGLINLDHNISMPLYRLRYIVACIYKLSRVPNEFEKMFKETVAKAKKRGITYMSDGTNKGRLKMDFLKNLFKCDFKSPDPEKSIIME